MPRRDVVRCWQLASSTLLSMKYLPNGYRTQPLFPGLVCKSQLTVLVPCSRRVVWYYSWPHPSRRPVGSPITASHRGFGRFCAAIIMYGGPTGYHEPIRDLLGVRRSHNFPVPLCPWLEMSGLVQLSPSSTPETALGSAINQPKTSRDWVPGFLIIIAATCY